MKIKKTKTNKQFKNGKVGKDKSTYCFVLQPRERVLLANHELAKSPVTSNIASTIPNTTFSIGKKGSCVYVRYD